MTELVSIVIPTYNRPDTLRVAIGSVLDQTWADWELIVIGDACEPATGAVIEEFDDPRISYINLPDRFGEQAGPNSVGLALASGSHVAFLNHDDVWLSDHLEQALAVVGADADFFVGQSAFAHRSIPDEEYGVAPLFTEVNPLRRKPRFAYTGDPALFEPASSWVVSAVTAQRIGPWRSASTIHRTPAQEWLMRAWRLGADFAFGSEITVLKVVTHYQYKSSAGNYSVTSREHHWLEALLKSQGADAIRASIVAQLGDGVDRRAPTTSRRTSRLKRISSSVLMGSMAAVYRLTGADGYDLYCRIARLPKGRVLDRASRRRVGTPLADQPDLEAVLAVLAGDRS